MVDIIVMYGVNKKNYSPNLKYFNVHVIMLMYLLIIIYIIKNTKFCDFLCAENFRRNFFIKNLFFSFFSCFSSICFFFSLYFYYTTATATTTSIATTTTNNITFIYIHTNTNTCRCSFYELLLKSYYHLLSPLDDYYEN